MTRWIVAMMLVATVASGGSAGYGIPGPGPGSSFFVDACLGRISGMSCVNKFGHNEDIDTASPEIVWEAGGSYTGDDATVADFVDLISTSADDNPAGAGARTVHIFGLDENWELQDEVIAMNGLGDATSLGKYLRVFRMIVETAAAGGGNLGIITTRPDGGLGNPAHVFGEMIANFSQSMIAAYTIPAGKTGYIINWYAALAGTNAANATIRLEARPPGAVYSTKEIWALRSAGTGLADRNYPLPKGPFVAKTDIMVRAFVSANNSEISAGFSVLLVDD